MTEQPMTVRRVEDATGSRIEPDFDQTWDEETKLRWKTALTAHDTGLVIALYPHPTPGRPTQYGVTIGEVNKGGQQSLSLGRYFDAWDALTLIGIGAEAVRNAIAHGEAP
ncbi:hypothetical protein [Streptomyces chartreusis]|uniref:hypothetical protein n=1 Tax=Streptomyces chartreusis TaxID=1969 RepID=UPI00123DD764|nr:hypothetical protein [Streptomyces chartreusis]QEV66194.1 hypothetical protein CP983_05650 [Streptomyces chartreusis]GGW98566.1 hypothetical protein GCM10010321_11160 [Streptomyces chartreusis]